MRWALVTGCSSGLGRSIALGLLREGVSVFAGVLNQAEADNLASDAHRHTGSGRHASICAFDPRCDQRCADPGGDRPGHTRKSEATDSGPSSTMRASPLRDRSSTCRRLNGIASLP